MTTTHTGFYDWGSVKQTDAEQLNRARVDLQMAADALERATPGSTSYGVILVRYERAERLVRKLEAGNG